MSPRMAEMMGINRKAYRDENRKDLVVLDPEQHILYRQHDEKRRGQRPVVGTPGIGQRHEFAKCREGTEAEEKQDADPPGDECYGDEDRHYPPGIDTGVEVLDGWVGAFRRQPSLQDMPHERGHEQDPADAEHENHHIELG